MSGRRVHQFTATLSPRDAVSHHTLEVDEILREMGHETELFAQSIHPELRHRARAFRDHEPLDADVLLYQASIGSPVADYLLSRAEPLVIDVQVVVEGDVVFRVHTVAPKSDAVSGVGQRLGVISE